MKTKAIIAILTATLLFACTKTDPNLVTINGEITNPVGEHVVFFNSDTSYTTTISKEGTFEISFSLDSSMYLDFQHGPEVTAMYVEPGNNIHLTIDTKLFDETIKYQGSPASSFLAKKYLWWETMDLYGEVYYLGNSEAYKSSLDEKKRPIVNVLEALKDSVFIMNEMTKIDNRMAHYVSMQKKMQEDLSEYGNDVRIYLMERKEMEKRYDFFAAIDSLSNKAFQDMLAEYSDSLNRLLSKVTNEDYTKMVKQNNEEHIRWLGERKILTDNMPKAGEPAVDFSYPDAEGNETSLSSLVGKLVYVDVWATWCGPCVAEIPQLKELEQEYHNKNIVFLSVSIDHDRDAWLDLLEEKELKGIQLWAGNLWEDGSMAGISRDYAIFGIPRFMLFSTDGTVITADAPRPSSPEIRKLLDSNL